jgi:hypothetical protein
MTRVEILNIRLDQLTNDLEKLENRRKALWSRRKEELKRVLQKYFETSDERFTIDFSDTRASLIDTKKGSHWSIVEAIITETWSREDDADKADDLRLSHNGVSYERIGEWVLDEAQARFEFMQIAVDHKDDILAEWNFVASKYGIFMQPFYSKERELRTAINSQQKDIAVLEDQALLSKLTTDGVEFKASERGRLPELEVKWDWTLRNISGLKVTRTTPSGKSADLVITQKFRNWDSEGVEVREQFVEKVRMDKVKKLLWNNEEFIK